MAQPQAGSHTHTINLGPGNFKPVNLYPEVEIEVDEGGFYTPFVEDKETGEKRGIRIPKPQSSMSPMAYVTYLKPEELEALKKIMNDRWTFVSGDQYDRNMMEACEAELKHRRKADPFLMQQIPSHSHYYTSNEVPGAVFPFPVSSEEWYLRAS